MVDPSSIDTRAELHAALKDLFDGDDRSYLALATDAQLAPATVHDMVNGKSFPRWSSLRLVLGACGITGASLSSWRQACERARRDDSDARLGTMLAEITDPFELEVHRPVTIESAGELPPLPRYVRRRHDVQLSIAVQRAVSGTSALVMLVGGSSVGKTRALWEALDPLRSAGGWRVWHPLTPTRRQAVAALERVSPRTVVWLNDAREYLADSDETVAAELRKLLLDPSRAPVLVLGTVWPGHYNELCERSRSRTRLLLEGNVIEVPERFTDRDLTALGRLAPMDPRLAAANEYAHDGQITQYLAGGPELLDRYHFAATAASRAVIEAAMDARRAGHRNALPRALLEAAAPAYMTDGDWDQCEDDWFDRALEDAGRPCKGARGPITRIRPRSTHLRAGRRNVRSASVGEDATVGGPVYQLAPYLDQYGGKQRLGRVPPVGFWEAVAQYAHPDDLAVLGNSARGCGLFRDAAQLFKHAVLQGHSTAAVDMVEGVRAVDPHDSLCSSWAVEHCRLDDVVATVALVQIFERAGSFRMAKALLAHRSEAYVSLSEPRFVATFMSCLENYDMGEALAALRARDPAAHVGLDDLFGISSFLRLLRRMGWNDQTDILLARVRDMNPDPATGMFLFLAMELRDMGADDHLELLARRVVGNDPLDSAHNVQFLLERLSELGAPSASAELLARRPAELVALDTDARYVAELLEALVGVGADAEVAALLARNPAVHCNLGLAPYGPVRLLRILEDLGADAQASALLTRVGARASTLTDPEGVAFVLHVLLSAHRDAETAALLARSPAEHVALDSACGVADLLQALWKAGAADQIDILLARNPAAQVGFGRSCGLGEVLDAFKQVGATEQIFTLLDRDPLEFLVFDSFLNIGKLQTALRDAKAHGHLAVLDQRLPAIGRFDKTSADYKTRFRFGREPDGSPAAPWGWDDLR